jgi:hypothetical protein
MSVYRSEPCLQSRPRPAWMHRLLAIEHDNTLSKGTTACLERSTQRFGSPAVDWLNLHAQQGSTLHSDNRDTIESLCRSEPQNRATHQEAALSAAAMGPAHTFFYRLCWRNGNKVSGGLRPSFSHRMIVSLIPSVPARA